MNPPSAIHGAMSRDRKPFTYTPGGLDLSEIKSERMAKRLMRNAMNEGVPQLPPQQLQSPPASTIAVPNFSGLPVQVFPAFNLPANPKSLLRTRSNPVSREAPLQRQPPPSPSQYVNNTRATGVGQYNTFNKNTPPYPQINNNRPSSMYEYGALGNVQPHNNMNYGNDGYDATFPEISYDAQYFQAPKINNNIECTVLSNSANTESINDTKISYTSEKKDETNIITATAPECIESIIDIKPEIATSEPEVNAMPYQEDVGCNDKQKEVKIVKNEVKEETNTQNQNGDQNGDTDAEMTIKLPTSKSAAKTETKVEISKKTLPDGSTEEVKKTITKTTIDGKTEIKTKTETTIIPKDDDYEEEEEEVEEEEEEESGEVNKKSVSNIERIEEKAVNNEVEDDVLQIQENGQNNIIKTEERSETTTTSTKKVVIVEDSQKEEQEDDEEELEEEEEEELEEAEPVSVVINKPSQPSPPPKEVKEVEKTQVDEDEEDSNKEDIKKYEQKEISQKVESDEEEVYEEITRNEINKSESKQEVEEEVEEEEEYEEAEEVEENKPEINAKEESDSGKVIQADKEEVSEEVKPESEEASEKHVEEDKSTSIESKKSAEEPKTPAVEIEIPIQIESDEKNEAVAEKQEEVRHDVTEQSHIEKNITPEPKLPLREPSVPLEKVEDVEIKPLSAGNFVKKSLTETTEIITGSGEKPTGLLTEYNRTENIVTVNRTTKTLDYENSAPQTNPTLTYFTPHIEKFPPLSPASRPYQPVYPSEPTSERRHSLLLERLSVERQIPTNEIYQNIQQYNQSVEQQNQWSQEPRVEILTIENVKPSSITNQQWYQQTKKEDVTYNNVSPVAQPAAPTWTQPKPQPQPVYQPPPQPTYQAQHPSQPTYKPPQPQSVYQSQSQFQPQAQPQYQSYTENLQQNTSSQQNTYSTYTPKPTNWASNTSNLDTLSNTQKQYSYKDSTNSYETQQRPSSYVPPPWEQDSTYIVDHSQSYQQPPAQNTFTPDHNQSWKPTPPTSKFTKTAYIPPKPNQSFVKHVTIAEPPKQPGRKTYYSEYERRYISVPESTYIPGETKLPPQIQPQPDPSPAYYYDNNEPAETVEHEWRKELREFTEKAQTQTHPENVKPPWEMETKTTQNYSYKDTQNQYAKTQETTYTATPTWSQTLRPQSWRERSFESEFVSQEWPKTNTLGRGRPLSSYGKESVPERTRGVSVDRYNPNNYQSPIPAEHPPVQTFTHNPPAPHATGYHNPNVPAYHARASAEPREQPVHQQPRAWREARASPFQSRSFKYLQWITGTED